MNARISKASTGRSRLKLSRVLQEQLLEAVARTGKHADHSAVSEHLLQDTPHQNSKRRLDATKIDLLPTKRIRLAQAAEDQPAVEDEKAEQVDKITLRQPKPQPPQHPYASFLKDFVDPVYSGPCLTPFHASISEWLESVGPDREEHCRSDSYLRYSDDVPISRALTRSVPEVSSTLDADGLAVPLTPVSCPGSVPLSDFPDTATSSGKSSGKSLIEEPGYLFRNLRANNILMRDPYEELPDNLAALVRDMAKHRNSPELSPDQVRYDRDLIGLEVDGACESDVEGYFRPLFSGPARQSSSLLCSIRRPMTGHTVPKTEGANYKVSSPVPDILYGYKFFKIFEQQALQLPFLESELMVNNDLMACPFFVVEFKGAGGRLEVAMNQCMGGSASCVNVAERLNERLRNCNSDKIQVINSAAFSVAMSGTEARLYISWKHSKLQYHVQKVKGFLLQSPKHHIEFRRYVKNILDWDEGERLSAIMKSVDSLLELHKEKASKAAKSRKPPSDGSGTSSRKKQKVSSFSDRKSSVSDNTHREGGGTSVGDLITLQDTDVEPAVPKDLPEDDQQKSKRYSHLARL
ncbi:hypothetical protein F5Y10DRAFT_285875 [Nemania abortiva]|nr:hypothetical protein F5Y10DRAFT_285875 [Nemania abortiva]